MSIPCTYSGHRPMGFRIRAHPAKDRSRFGPTGFNNAKTTSLKLFKNYFAYMRKNMASLVWKKTNHNVGFLKRCGLCIGAIKELCILAAGLQNQHMALMALIGQSTFLHKTVSLKI